MNMAGNTCLVFKKPVYTRTQTKNFRFIRPKLYLLSYSAIHRLRMSEVQQVRLWLNIKIKVQIKVSSKNSRVAGRARDNYPVKMDLSKHCVKISAAV